MIEKIKKYFKQRKIKKQIQHELLETMASICLYLDYEARKTHNPYGKYMKSHFEGMKHFAEIIRAEHLQKQETGEKYAKGFTDGFQGVREKVKSSNNFLQKKMNIKRE